MYKRQLPNDIKKIIIENKELYDIGLHGPDLLFYYLPLKNNEINSIGYNTVSYTHLIMILQRNY